MLANCLLLSLFFRNRKWNGPKQVLLFDANSVIGIEHHVSGFVKILQSVSNQGPQRVTITVEYTLQGKSHFVLTIYDRTENWV